MRANHRRQKQPRLTCDDDKHCPALRWKDSHDCRFAGEGLLALDGVGRELTAWNRWNLLTEVALCVGFAPECEGVARIPLLAARFFTLRSAASVSSARRLSPSCGRDSCLRRCCQRGQAIRKILHDIRQKTVSIPNRISPQILHLAPKIVSGLQVSVPTAPTTSTCRHGVSTGTV
jgi:hypothetical protein